MFVNEQPKWNDRAVGHANPLANMGADLISGNSALPMSNTPRVSLVVELPKVDLSTFDERPTARWKFIRQLQT